jgi:hypothetical protein
MRAPTRQALGLQEVLVQSEWLLHQKILDDGKFEGD